MDSRTRIEERKAELQNALDQTRHAMDEMQRRMQEFSALEQRQVGALMILDEMMQPSSADNNALSEEQPAEPSA